MIVGLLAYRHGAGFHLSWPTPATSLSSAPTGLVKDVVEQFPEAVVVGSKVCLQVRAGCMVLSVCRAGKQAPCCCWCLLDGCPSPACKHKACCLLLPCAVSVQPHAPAVPAAGRQGW